MPAATCCNLQQLAAIMSFVLLINHLLHTISAITLKTLVIVESDQELKFFVAKSPKNAATLMGILIIYIDEKDAG